MQVPCVRVSDDGSICLVVRSERDNTFVCVVVDPSEGCISNVVLLRRELRDRYPGGVEYDTTEEQNRALYRLAYNFLHTMADIGGKAPALGYLKALVGGKPSEELLRRISDAMRKRGFTT